MQGDKCILSTALLVLCITFHMRISNSQSSQLHRVEETTITALKFTGNAWHNLK